MLFNWTKLDKTRKFFLGSPLFQSIYNKKTTTTTEKTNNSTYLVSVACGRVVEGTGHETDCLPHPTDTKYIELIVCFSVFLLYVASKRGLPRKFARFVLFCPIKKRCFNSWCVLDLFCPGPEQEIQTAMKQLTFNIFIHR